MYSDLTSPATIRHIEIFMQSVRQFSPILTTLELFRYIFIQVLDINFHGNPSRGNCAYIWQRCGCEDGRTDREKDRESDFVKASEIFTAEPGYNDSYFATLCI
jgi:hypothetical protein